MKSFKEYLQEGKQVGTLYHYTNLQNCSHILADNYLKSYGEYRAHISFTRDAKFHARYVTGNIATQVRISVDGNKLSHKYRITPYHDLDWFKNKPAQTENDEMEEAVLATRIKDVSNYITDIKILLPDKELVDFYNDDYWSFTVTRISDLCKEKEIPLYNSTGETIQ